MTTIELTEPQAMLILRLLEDELNGVIQQKLNAEHSNNIPLYKILSAYSSVLTQARTNYLDTLKRFNFSKG